MNTFNINSKVIKSQSMWKTIVSIILIGLIVVWFAWWLWACLMGLAMTPTFHAYVVTYDGIINSVILILILLIPPLLLISGFLKLTNRRKAAKILFILTGVLMAIFSFLAFSK